MNVQALELIGIYIASRESHLDLGNCELTDDDFFENSPLDIALRKCRFIQTLILSNEWYDYEKGKVVKSRNKGLLNYLTSCPSSILTLKGLTKLILCGDFKKKWGIKDTSFVSNLNKLTWLDISNNQIQILNGFKNLKNLKLLAASGNQIQNLTGVEIYQI